MKFTQDERRVINCLYLQADLPLREVAEQINLKEHVVRRCLNELLAKNAIAYRCFVNPYAAGLCEYTALINTPLMAPATRQLLKKTLLDSPHTTFVGTVGGDYHLDAMFLAQDLVEATEILDSFSAGVQGAAFEISVATCRAVTLFQPKFLGVAEGLSRHVTYGATRSVALLDELDHKILYTLGVSPSSSTAKLAQALGLPASTVSYRTQSLKERGVLAGLGLTITPFNDGYFPFALQLRAGSMPKKTRDDLFDYCSKHPSISYLIEAIGDWNFEIGARLEDPRTVPALADDIQRRFVPHVSRVTVIPIHEYLKILPHPLVSVSAFKMKQRVA